MEWTAGCAYGFFHSWCETFVYMDVLSSVLTRISTEQKRRHYKTPEPHSAPRNMRVSALVGLALLVIAVCAGTVLRGRRQVCECSPAEAPQCGCQVVPSNSSKNVQMVCSCSAPIPPKCVCKMTNSLPVLPSPDVLPPAPQFKCTDVCQSSCLESCNRLQTNSKCTEVCSDACQFSCSKQENINISPITSKENSVREYKFIIPNEATKSTIKIQPIQPLLTIHPSLPAVTPSSTSVRINNNKICEVECMPECTFTCTALKPALKLISQIVDTPSTTVVECQRTCGESCMKVCRSSGILLDECSTKCAPACGQSCGFIKNSMCVSSCMPSCNPQCLEAYIGNPSTDSASAMLTSKSSSEALLEQLTVKSTTTEMPTLIFPVSKSSVPRLQALCKNECSVQCEHQCGVNSLAGPQCLAACQTTCYPVCQSKFRRRHLHQELPIGSGLKRATLVV